MNKLLQTFCPEAYGQKGYKSFKLVQFTEQYHNTKYFE